MSDTATLQEEERLSSQTPHQHRMWGLSITAIHDRFWAARGIQVVRQGEPAELIEAAELFMLLDRRLLTIFRPALMVESMYWSGAAAIFARIHDSRGHPYVERVVTTSDGLFERVERDYGHGERLARVALTTSRDLAAMWQRTGEIRDAWRDLRRRVPRIRRATGSVSGSLFDRNDDQQAADFMRQLLTAWKMPSATIPSIKRSQPALWSGTVSDVEKIKSIGPVWVGTGREVKTEAMLVGPAILWDNDPVQADASKLNWTEIEPTAWISGSGRIRQKSVARKLFKRLFDIAFSGLALVLISPIFPLVMLAIYLEDGGPFLFGHERESLGGRRFQCLKFRSMRKDAEIAKLDLAKQNQADGPQFYIDNDPRITRVGKILRKFNIDELPQFLNVLRGDMSVVGPRPSPFKENQYNPTWRETRLSVLPGITGLWQVRRTRKHGADFQEWIKFDIEYVETATFMLDLKIIWETITTVCFGRGRN